MKRNSRPNILLIISDQQRVDTLSHLNRTPCKTPHLDRLAATGVSFTRCATPCPLCAPARCGIFTGRHPHQVHAKWRDLAAERVNNPGSMYDTEDVPTMTMNGGDPVDPMPFTEPLRSQGYFLDYVGKWHLNDDILPDTFDHFEANSISSWPKGIETWAFMSDERVVTKTQPRMSIPTPVVEDLPPEETMDAWIADVTIQHMKNRPGDRPFFLTCGFIGPHPPFKVPEPYFSMYDPTAIPIPPNFLPNERERACNPNNYYRQICRDFSTDWEPWKKAFAAYWGFCTHIDHQTGRILKALDDEGLTEDTLVIYCSDHGEMLGAHGLFQKYEPYEEDLRVPLIFSAPWLSQNVVSDATVSLLDLMPTLMSQGGTEVPEELEGEDLSSLLAPDGVDTFQERYVYSEHKPLGSFHNTVEWRLVTDNRWKYVWNNGDLDELFDLGKDPYETTNLIDNPEAAAEQSRLQNALKNHMTVTTDPFVDAYVEQTF